MKILAFGASNHSNSINQKLAIYIAQQFGSQDTEILDLNDYEMPIYSIDREISNGVPAPALAFAEKIDSADLIVISLAEYNSSYSVAFKNIYDWVSRIPNRAFATWGGKSIFLASTSPGPRGGLSVLEAAKARFPFDKGNIIADFSLPNFGENFDAEKGIINEEKKAELLEKINQILKQ